MARCSPLSDFAAASAAEVKDPNVVDDLVEMARAVAGELAGTSDGEGPTLSVGGADTSVGASNNENSRMYYFGSSTITRGKIKKMVEQGILPKARPGSLERKRSQSLMTTKPLSMRTFLSLVYACLRILFWATFYCTSRRNCTS
jgi:hypothetical protein